MYRYPESNKMELVDSKKVDDETNNLQGFIKDDIKNKLNVLNHTGPPRGIAQGPDWSDASSVYGWIQKFTLDRGNRRLVKSFDIKLYKLQHRYPATKTYEKQKAKSANLDMRNDLFDNEHKKVTENMEKIDPKWSSTICVC
ncbi:unnamed protein product [Rhizophagus irregularis]|nr:unnamed protein product [Rhizophagus irregularis]